MLDVTRQVEQSVDQAERAWVNVQVNIDMADQLKANNKALEEQINGLEKQIEALVDRVVTSKTVVIRERVMKDQVTLDKELFETVERSKPDKVKALLEDGADPYVFQIHNGRISETKSALIFSLQETIPRNKEAALKVIDELAAADTKWADVSWNPIGTTYNIVHEGIGYDRTAVDAELLARAFKTGIVSNEALTEPQVAKAKFRTSVADRSIRGWSDTVVAEESIVVGPMTFLSMIVIQLSMEWVNILSTLEGQDVSRSQTRPLLIPDKVVDANSKLKALLSYFYGLINAGAADSTTKKLLQLAVDGYSFSFRLTKNTKEDAKRTDGIGAMNENKNKTRNEGYNRGRRDEDIQLYSAWFAALMKAYDERVVAGP